MAESVSQFHRHKVSLKKLRYYLSDKCHVPQKVTIKNFLRIVFVYTLFIHTQHIVYKTSHKNIYICMYLRVC